MHPLGWTCHNRRIGFLHSHCFSSGFCSCCHVFYLVFFLSYKRICVLFQCPHIFRPLSHRFVQACCNCNFLSAAVIYLFIIDRILLKSGFSPKLYLNRKVFPLAISRINYSSRIPSDTQDASQAVTVVMRSVHRFSSPLHPFVTAESRDNPLSKYFCTYGLGFFLCAFRKTKKSSFSSVNFISLKHDGFKKLTLLHGYADFLHPIWNQKHIDPPLCESVDIPIVSFFSRFQHLNMHRNSCTTRCVSRFSPSPCCSEILFRVRIVEDDDVVRGGKATLMYLAISKQRQ